MFPDGCDRHASAVAILALERRLPLLHKRALCFLLGGGKAIIVGHAYGNWVARMTAADHPDLVRGAVIAAAAAKQYAPELSTAVTNAGNLSLSDEERLAALRFAFFAPGNDPTVWLKGWHPEIPDSQRAAVAAVKAGRMVVGRHVAAPGFAGRKGPFQARIQTKRDEERVWITRHGDAHSVREPRFDSRTAQGRRRLSWWIKSLP